MISCVGFENNGTLVVTPPCGTTTHKVLHMDGRWEDNKKKLSLTKKGGGFLPFLTMVVCKIYMHGGFISNAPNQINKILNFTI
jgi:hypothetical protein